MVQRPSRPAIARFALLSRQLKVELVLQQAQPYMLRDFVAPLPTRRALQQNPAAPHLPALPAPGREPAGRGAGGPSPDHAGRRAARGLQAGGRQTLRGVLGPPPYIIHPIDPTCNVARVRELSGIEGLGTRAHGQ